MLTKEERKRKIKSDDKVFLPLKEKNGEIKLEKEPTRAKRHSHAAHRQITMAKRRKTFVEVINITTR